MGVFVGKIVCPPTPTVGVCDGLVAPQNSVRTEKVALVSRRRQMGRPSTRRLTLGSRNDMVVTGRGVPRPLQSSVASPMRSGLECETDPTPPPGARAISCLISRGMASRTWPWWQLGVGTGFGPTPFPSTAVTGAQRMSCRQELRTPGGTISWPPHGLSQHFVFLAFSLFIQGVEHLEGSGQHLGLRSEEASIEFL
jgi:hypothetical protein